MIWYETKYTQWYPRKKVEKTHTYRTKSLTSLHAEIHKGKNVRKAVTLKCDDSIKWPFGVWAEVIEP